MGNCSESKSNWLGQRRSYQSGSYYSQKRLHSAVSREGPGRKRYCCKVIRDVQKEKAPSNKRCIKSNGLVCSKNLTGGATGGGFCLGDGVQVFPGEDCQH